ncbi:hypothetical protein K3X44_15485 (plasmid) [Aliiroseovarius crassostreae]|uniref:hypothetical protein n=1 Tax=Aliiroseovarius crassostreae TaxID=154981 RepID=UPI00220A956D|nr:hypothetical protein [Aliiroseovarius crassostreae]UWQ03520.1 hypothetical protein K3X44_15485 [Aliiroseovarius crassostreae]
MIGRLKLKKDPFHQEIEVSIRLSARQEPGTLNRILKSLGAILHYDVYSFPRSSPGPNWQSENLASVYLFCDGKEVDAQEKVDQIQLRYPLATIGAEHVNSFASLVAKLSNAPQAEATLDGRVVDADGIVQHCDGLASDLMEQWGEEPGSKSLRVLIEENYY